MTEIKKFRQTNPAYFISQDLEMQAISTYNKPVAKEKLLKRLYGEDAWDLYGSQKDALMLDESVGKQIDDAALAKIGRLYGFTHTDDLRRHRETIIGFYRNAQEMAHKTVQGVITTALPEKYINIFGTRNEAAFPHRRPSYLFVKANGAAANRQETFEHELNQVLLPIALDVDRIIKYDDPGTRILELQDFFNTNLFEAGRSTQIKEFHVLHNNQTNEAVDLGSRFDNDSSYHIKTHLMSMGHIPGFGNAMVQPRIKDARSAIEKGWEKHHQRGKFNVFEDVPDFGGIMFCVEGGKQMRSELTNMQIALLREHPLCVDIVPDHGVDGRNKNGSAEMDWERLKVYWSDKYLPTEIVNFDFLGNQNYYHNLQQKKGVNYAHSLFRHERIRNTFLDFRPPDIYTEEYEKLASVGGGFEEAYAEKRRHIENEQRNSRAVMWRTNEERALSDDDPPFIIA